MPHLQRLSPNGNELASFDADSGTMRIWDARGNSGLVREYTVSGLGGQLLQVRWAADSKSLLLLTTRGLFRVSSAATNTFAAVELFSGKHDFMLEFRVLPGGVALHAGPRRNKRRSLWFVSLDGSHPVRLTPSARDVESFTTLATGQVIAELAGIDGAADELLTIVPGPTPEIVRTQTCAAADVCQVVNWTSRAGNYAYATQRCPQPGESGVCKQAKVHVVDSSGKTTTFEPLRSKYSGFPRKLSQLWARQQGYITAGGSRLVTWTNHEDAWLWRPPKIARKYGSYRPNIASTAVDPATDDVLAAAGLRVYRISDNRAKRLFTVHKPKLKDRSRHVDGLIALPNGDIAYQILDTHERTADIYPDVDATAAPTPNYPELDRAMSLVTSLSESCYRPALERSLAARGELRLQIVVHPSGRAFVTRVDNSNAKKLWRSADCLVRELADTRLPTHTNRGLVGLDTTVRFKLTAPRD